MEIVTFTQGSPEWHSHRATHFNASDAPAMLGCSPYKTRTQLLQELKSGVSPEVDVHLQRRYDDGHRFEALARPLMEKIVGEELAPLVGTLGKFSASFDGLTILNDTGVEHKSLNDQLRAALMSDEGAAALPKHYRVQMEQQCLVSGAERILFMATKWADDDSLLEEMHAWYTADPVLRAEIVAGWAQFERDLAEFVMPERIAPIAAEAVESLPAPVIQVSGSLTLQDNFKVFEERLREFLSTKLIREPKTDEDFVNLDAQIKAMKQGREALKSARAQMLAQVQPVDQANKTADMLDNLLQENCSMAERLLKDEKERRRGEIVAQGVSALRSHIDGLNARLGKPFMPVVPADFGGIIKGLKSLASMEDKVRGELARAKIAANETADRIDRNLKHLATAAADYTALFPDLATIATKEAQDFEALVQFRVTDHKAKEQKRADELAEQSRERIRKEEADRIAREQAAAAPAPIPAAAPASPAPAAINSVAPPAPAVIAMPTRTAPPTTAPALSLGQIKERIAPLSITAEGMATLGFVGLKERGSVLFHESDFPHICAALVEHLQRVQTKRAA